MEKGKVYGPMKYYLNGKGFMAPMESILMVSSRNGKGMVYERLFFEVVTVMVKDEKNAV